MASNFNIIRHHNSDNLHLKLVGDLDGSAAMELVHVIEESAGWFRRIFVHTCGLSSLHPFGESVFVRNLSLSRLGAAQIMFTGAYGRNLRSETIDYRMPEEYTEPPSEQRSYVH